MGSIGVGELRCVGNFNAIGANVDEEQGLVVFVR